MNCPSCGAPMKLKSDMQSFRCEYCLSVYFPEKNDDGVRVLDEPSGHDCPVCVTPLVHAFVAKSPVIYCAKCNGMLVAMAALEDTIDALRAEHGSAKAPPPPDKDDLRRKINCPQCHRHMDAHIYGGPGNVIIDSCETCCVLWLDRGELMRIAYAPDGRSASSSSGSFDSQSSGSWSGAGERPGRDLYIDSIVDSFLK